MKINPVTKAVALSILAAFLYAVMAIIIKGLSSIPPFEKLFFRSLFGLVAILIISYNNKISFKTNKKIGVAMRGLAGLAALITYYTALSNAPMAEVVTLSNIGPFFIIIFSWVFLSEKITKLHLVALFLSFGGAVIISNPDFGTVNWFFLLAILSSLFSAIAFTLVKYLRFTENSETIVFYYSFISTFGCLPFILIEDFVIPNPIELILLIALGLTATCYQMCLTTAYKYAPASKLSVYGYMGIVFSTLFGILLFDEFPDIFAITGILCILFSGIILYKAQ